MTSKIPEWMFGNFDEYWTSWQKGEITYSKFCELISNLPEVPRVVVANHKRSCEELIDDINKAVYVYKRLREKDAGLVEDLLEGYNTNVKYGIV